MGAFPNLSRNVPFCPRLSSFVPICPRSGPQEGQKRTNGDKTGHFGTNRETPPFSIYPRFSSLFLCFSLFFSYSPGTRANDCNLLGKWGISLRPRLHRPRSELPEYSIQPVEGATMVPGATPKKQKTVFLIYFVLFLRVAVFFRKIQRGA